MSYQFEQKFLSSYLSYSIDDKKKCEEMVDSLLGKHGSIEWILEQGFSELEKEVGSQIATSLYILASVLSRRYTQKMKVGQIWSQEEIKNYLRLMYFGASFEYVLILFFDEKNRFLSSAAISEGTTDASDIIPRKALDAMNTVKEKVKYAIMAHNHPCGRAVASKEDMGATSMMMKALATVDVELTWHYIVAGKNVYGIDVNVLKKCV